MIQQTSLDVYDEIVLPQLSHKQEQVLRVFKDGQAYTNLEVSEKLGIPINCVTPRIYELRGKDLLTCFGTRRQSTGREALLWGLVE